MAEVYFGPIRITVAGVVIKLSFPKCIFRRILGGVAEASVPPGKKKKRKHLNLNIWRFLGFADCWSIGGTPKEFRVSTVKRNLF